MHGMKGVAARAAAAMMAVCVLAGPQVRAEPRVEVLHWWTSGGEAAAARALKEAFTAAGGRWIDSPVAGGGGDAAMTALRARVMAGNPPGAVQLKGPNIDEWAAEGVLGSLDAVAEAGRWKDLLPPLVLDVIRYQDHYVAVPVNIHRVNWIWGNPAVLAKVGAGMPATWDEFNATADKLKAAGITPLAHGGQPWQDATIFEVVLLGLGGPDYYKKALVEIDKTALHSDTMRAVFAQMRRLRGYVDPNFPGRDWNLATAMLMNGSAGFQIMGDWAKGEIAAAGKVPGRDILCAASPGKGFILNSDSFAMFKVSSRDDQAGQDLLARLIMGEGFQETFSLNKGSIPVRLGLPLDKFDECAKKSAADLKAAIDGNGIVPSMAHEMAVSRSVRGAIMDVVTAHFNSTMSDTDAVARLAEAIELAM